MRCVLRISALCITIYRAGRRLRNFKLSCNLFGIILIVHSYLHTYSMEQSPSWEANRLAASQEIPRTLLNPKVDYRIHKCPALFSILRQFNPVHTPTYHFLKIHLNTRNIFPSMPGSPQWPLSLKFPHQNPVHASPLPHTRYLPPSHYSRFYHPHNTGWGVQIIKLLII